MEPKIYLRVTQREASLLRSALHIACALTAKADPYANRKLSNEFAVLHGELRDFGVESFERDTILKFEDDVIAACRDSDVEAQLLRDLFARPLTVGYGMREMDYAAIEARVMACLLDPIPPLVIDASQLPFEFVGTVTGRSVIGSCSSICAMAASPSPTGRRCVSWVCRSAAAMQRTVH